MTFTYSSKVSNVRLLGLARLLIMWKASIYKLVFREILIYIGLYAAISAFYRVLLRPTQKKKFEEVVIYCTTFEGVLPLTFVLGFYVTFVAQRWWGQFSSMSWPDRIMSYISCFVQGESDKAIMVRRSLMRYLIQSQIMLLRSISSPVRKRFPKLRSLVDQGLMTEEELSSIEDENVPNISSKYWIPTQWFSNLLIKARKEQLIKDNYSLNTLLNELSLYKAGLGNIFIYDWINIPLVYTQVATIAVYVFFVTTLISRQFINWESVKEEFGDHAAARYKIDMYFPFFTVAQLFFYVGWLKVAEQMLNPFGKDDDDFECNWIIDRNLKVGLFVVDNMYLYHPPLVKDQFWDDLDPSLKYTAATERYRMPEGWFGSLHNLALAPPDELPNKSQQHLPKIIENGKGDFDSNISLYNSDMVSVTTGGSPVKPVRRLPPMMSMDNLDMLKRSVKRIPLPILFRGSNKTENSKIEHDNELNQRSPSPSHKYLIGSAPHGYLSGNSERKTVDKTETSQKVNISTKNIAANSSSDCDSTTPLVTVITEVEQNTGDENNKDTSLEETNTVTINMKTIEEQSEEGNGYVAQWMSNSNNDFGEELLNSQVLSSSACQLTALEEQTADASPLPHTEVYEQPPVETSSVCNLSDVIVSQEMLNLLNPENNTVEKCVAFEPEV